MLTLVCPFMYIYTWASIHTTSIFKTSTEVLSVVLHTCCRNTQSCLVCRLKGKTLLLPCRVKNGQINYQRYITAAARTGGESFPFSQDTYSSPFINLSSFSVTLDPNESMPAPSRRNVFFSGTMLTLVCRFMYIYTWASIHTTSIFKTSTEVLSIVIHTCSKNTHSCLILYVV